MHVKNQDHGLERCVWAGGHGSQRGLGQGPIRLLRYEVQGFPGVLAGSQHEWRIGGFADHPGPLCLPVGILPEILVVCFRQREEGLFTCGPQADAAPVHCGLHQTGPALVAVACGRESSAYVLGPAEHATEPELLNGCQILGVARAPHRIQFVVGQLGFEGKRVESVDDLPAGELAVKLCAPSGVVHAGRGGHHGAGIIDPRVQDPERELLFTQETFQFVEENNGATNGPSPIFQQLLHVVLALGKQDAGVRPFLAEHLDHETGLARHRRALHQDGGAVFQKIVKLLVCIAANVVIDLPVGPVNAQRIQVCLADRAGITRHLGDPFIARPCRDPVPDLRCEIRDNAHNGPQKWTEHTPHPAEGTEEGDCGAHDGSGERQNQPPHRRVGVE